MEEAIKILKHSEVVLMKKIKGLQDGKPKYAASAKLAEIRNAIAVLTQYDNAGVMDEAEENEVLAEMFEAHPPKAKA
jgi:hypothetical protein